MMVMTAKVDFKKIILILGGLAAAVAVLILLFGGSRETAAPSLSANDGRVEYLKGFGWEVAASPVESGQVLIPEQSTEVFNRYNQLQKTQGFDLTQYAGKNVMRYVYKVTNYPGATDPVYATLLVYKDRVIGADITDTAPGGQIRGLSQAGTEPPIS